MHFFRRQNKPSWEFWKTTISKIYEKFRGFLRDLSVFWVVASCTAVTLRKCTYRSAKSGVLYKDFSTLKYSFGKELKFLIFLSYMYPLL